MSSSLAKCSGDFKSPDNKLLYSNFGRYSFGDLFLSFVFVNACRRNRSHVSASSSPELLHLVRKIFKV